MEMIFFSLGLRKECCTTAKLIYDFFLNFGNFSWQKDCFWLENFSFCPENDQNAILNLRGCPWNFLGMKILPKEDCGWSYFRSTGLILIMFLGSESCRSLKLDYYLSEVLTWAIFDWILITFISLEGTLHALNIGMLYFEKYFTNRTVVCVVSAKIMLQNMKLC